MRRGQQQDVQPHYSQLWLLCEHDPMRTEEREDIDRDEGKRDDRPAPAPHVLVFNGNQNHLDFPVATLRFAAKCTSSLGIAAFWKAKICHASRETVTIERYETIPR